MDTDVIPCSYKGSSTSKLSIDRRLPCLVLRIGRKWLPFFRAISSDKLSCYLYIPLLCIYTSENSLFFSMAFEP